MFSEPIKQGLLKHHPNMIIVDAFSSSEAVGMGQSMSTGAGGTAHTAKFTVGENTIVIGDDGKQVEPGSGDIGRVAVGGYQPIGYYKDEEKTARTFIEFEGRRYSCPGDYAMVEADGSLTLLGRGSVCINTGGEKVFPEEVEEVLKTHPAVRDAVAVGIPDEKFGEVVAAVVEPSDGADVEPADVIAHVRSKLAAYKAPKQVVVVDDHRPGAQRQGRLQAPQGRGRPRPPPDARPSRPGEHPAERRVHGRETVTPMAAGGYGSLRVRAAQPAAQAVSTSSWKTSTPRSSASSRS